MPGVHIAHAATAIGSMREPHRTALLATGGRVLGVVAVGNGLRRGPAAAHTRRSSTYDSTGGQYRPDIAARVAE